MSETPIIRIEVSGAEKVARQLSNLEPTARRFVRNEMRTAGTGRGVEDTADGASPSRPRQASAVHRPRRWSKSSVIR